MTNTNQSPAEDVETAALVALASANIPTDVQELLVRGDPMRGIAPGALTKAVLAVTSSKAEPSRIAEVQALLLDEAKRHSDFTKSMQARRKAEYIERGETAPDYRGMESEETIYWEAATIITAIEAELTAQKAAHAKMLRDEADIFDSGLEPNDHIGGELAEMLRRLADKIEGGE